MKFDDSVKGYLRQTKIPLRLSTVTASGWPLILSLWYLYDDGALYCATPQHARAAAYLALEPRCAFEVAADEPPYCGIRGQALATIDADRGVEILERLLIRYLGGTDNPLGQGLLKRPTPEVAIRLEPQNIFTWNFSDRMASSLKGSVSKICPD